MITVIVPVSFMYVSLTLALLPAATHFTTPAGRFNCRHVPQMLNYAGKDYLVACQNHVVLNISSRVRKAFSIFFTNLCQNFNNVDCKKVLMHPKVSMSNPSYI